MRVEYILMVTVAVQTIGFSVFKRFATEVPAWANLLKWTVFHAGSVVLFYAVGPWALLFPASILVLGLSLHVYVCRKFGFHPLYATPRKEYYAFRGWTWPPE